MKMYIACEKKERYRCDDFKICNKYNYSLYKLMDKTVFYLTRLKKEYCLYGDIRYSAASIFRDITVTYEEAKQILDICTEHQTFEHEQWIKMYVTMKELFLFEKLKKKFTRISDKLAVDDAINERKYRLHMYHKLIYGHRKSSDTQLQLLFENAYNDMPEDERKNTLMYKVLEKANDQKGE